MKRHQKRDRTMLARTNAFDPIQFEIDRRSCNQKRAFRSKQDARNKLKLTQRNNGGGSIYECVVCGNWHVTSDTREQTRRIRGVGQ